MMGHGLKSIGKLAVNEALAVRRDLEPGLLETVFAMVVAGAMEAQALQPARAGAGVMKNGCSGTVNGAPDR